MSSQEARRKRQKGRGQGQGLVKEKKREESREGEEVEEAEEEEDRRAQGLCSGVRGARGQDGEGLGFQWGRLRQECPSRRWGHRAAPRLGWAPQHRDGQERWGMARGTGPSLESLKTMAWATSRG